MDKIQLHNRTLCNLKEKIIYKEIEMEIKQIERTIETITTVISIASFSAYLFPTPQREMILSLLALIIVPIGMIVNTVIKAFNTENWRGFILQMLILILELAIMSFGIFVFTITLYHI